MDHPLIDLINARIRQAQDDGAFDNLPGAGRPLPDCDGDPDAVLGRILRANGALPETVVLRREIAALRAVLADTADRSERRRLLQDIALLDTRIEIARSRR